MLLGAFHSTFHGSDGVSLICFVDSDVNSSKVARNESNVTGQACALLSNSLVRSALEIESLSGPGSCEEKQLQTLLHSSSSHQRSPDSRQTSHDARAYVFIGQYLAPKHVVDGLQSNASKENVGHAVAMLEKSVHHQSSG